MTEKIPQKLNLTSFCLKTLRLEGNAEVEIEIHRPAELSFDLSIS